MVYLVRAKVVNKQCLETIERGHTALTLRPHLDFAPTCRAVKGELSQLEFHNGQGNHNHLWMMPFE